MSKLEDIFAGTLELTASELAYLRHAIVENFMNGGWFPKGENRQEFTARIYTNSARSSSIAWSRQMDLGLSPLKSTAPS